MELLEQDFTVMQVRPAYSIVYQFKPQLKLKSEDISTKEDFLTFLKELTLNWKDGEYFFTCREGTFVYFKVDGKRVKLYKKSSRTGKEYLCWQYFYNGYKKKKGKK